MSPVVRVAWARLAAYDDADLDLLDDDERSRLPRFTRDDDRRRFALGAALLHRELAAATGGDPAAPVVVRTCPTCGRPHGRPRPLAAGWWASVSHAGDVVTVATTQAGPVGVDVEDLRVVDDATMAVALRPAELAWVRAEPSSSARRFRLVWTAKEAVVKALGTGVPAMDDVEVDPEHGFRVTAGPAPAVVHHLEAAGQPLAVALLGAATMHLEVAEVR